MIDALAIFLRRQLATGVALVADVPGTAAGPSGLNQARILPGSMHWIIQIIHLLLGLGAIGLAENLACRTKAQPPRARAALDAA